MAVVFPLELITRLSRAGVPVWLTDQVSGTAAGTLGSEAVTAKLPPDPESTAWLAMGFTVGAAAALTVTVVVAVEGPPQLVAVSVRLTEVVTATWGAV